MKLTAALSLASAVAATLVLAPPLTAGPPQPASGTGFLTSAVITHIRHSDGNLRADFTMTGVMSGTLTGTFVNEGYTLVHPDGNRSSHSTLTFTGLTPCGFGTATARLVGVGDTGSAEGVLTTIAASSNTANIGLNVKIAQVGPVLSYSGNYVCR
jgi:hypothetical protein